MDSDISKRVKIAIVGLVAIFCGTFFSFQLYYCIPRAAGFPIFALFAFAGGLVTVILIQVGSYILKLMNMVLK